jgi:hypothetical protein
MYPMLVINTKSSSRIYDLEVSAIYVQESVDIELKEKKGCVYTVHVQ